METKLLSIAYYLMYEKRKMTSAEAVKVTPSSSLVHLLSSTLDPDTPLQTVLSPKHRIFIAKM